MIEWLVFGFIVIYGIYGATFVKNAKSIKHNKTQLYCDRRIIEASLQELIHQQQVIDNMQPGYEKFRAKEQLIRDVNRLLLEHPSLHQEQQSNIIQLRQLVR